MSTFNHIKKHPPQEPAQGETLSAILRHGKLMKMAGAPSKDIARAIVRKCQEAQR